MATNNVDLFDGMRRELVQFRSGAVAVGDLSNRLLALRDRLEFDDPDWHHQVTDHTVTLDSA